MADLSNSTPAPARANDRELAAAYRDMESAIMDLRSMALLMEMAVEDTIGARGGKLIEHVQRHAGLGDGYRIIALTKDQSDGLEYALNHIGNLARDLSRTYYAGFGEKVA